MSNVHNHGPAEGRGLDCGDRLVGNCMVVIDPESTDEAEAIVKAFVAAGCWRVIPVDVENSHAHRREQVQAALREFANPTPPKPDEPTGLGAVVEDADGQLWVRHEHVALAYMHWHRVGANSSAKWQGINVVRVLSEGVSDV